MKKLVLLFGATVLALTSCSKDNSDSAASALTGLVKTISTGSTTTTYTYDGAKITSASTPAYSQSYIYTGDLITGTTMTASGYIYSTQYTYNKGQLFSSSVKDNGGSGTTMNPSSSSLYTYNSDQTISVEESTYTNGDAEVSDTRKFTLINGNIVKEEVFDPSNNSTSVTTYQYDTKNNPYKKMVGYDKIISATLTSVNNIVNTTKTSGSGSSKVTLSNTSVYTYNADGYPLTKANTTVTTVGTNAPKTTVSNLLYTY